VTLAAAHGLPHGGPPLASPHLDPWLGLALGIALVLLNGFFVAAEFALVKVRPTQIDPHVARGSRRGKVARHMIAHLDAYLSATQLGITLASLALGWIGNPAFSWLIEPLVGRLGVSPAAMSTISITLAFLVITILHIVLGELAPKSLAIRKPEGATLFTALPLFVFYKLTYPAIWVLNHGANAILRLVGVQPVTESELAHDEGELRMLLASADASRLSKQKRELLDNIFELSHRMARQIMVPRADVIYLSTTRPLEENLEIARESGHSRFPLCEGDLDHSVGLVHIKDLFRVGRPESLEQVAREIAFVPETLELDRLLRRMRTERLHMAAVVDEYGGISGIVTLENVIEEIVGSIQDEFDFEHPELVKKGGNVYLVSGGMLVDELEQTLDLEFSDRDEDTIGGVVLSELGRRPEVGDHVTLGPLDIEVVDVEGHRVRQVRATVREEEAAERS
jgi:CBS domain containing-hemolysin-like protein